MSELSFFNVAVNAYCNIDFLVPVLAKSPKEAEENAKNVPFSTLVGYASDNINFTILGAVKHG